ncbi:MAG: hypothetical protein JWP25_3578 [Bradyrhizobium sp.]|nr:hypothetical protein [Bradyrhizobium sp.]
MEESATVEFVAIRKGSALVPATAFDLEQLEKLPRNKPGRVHFSHPRSAARNRWYRCFVSVIAEGVGTSPGALHAELKFKAGLVKSIILSKAAGTVVELKSTAFASMEESEFSEFVSLAVEIAFAEYLPGVRRRDVLARVRELVGGSEPWERNSTILQGAGSVD